MLDAWIIKTIKEKEEREKELARLFLELPLDDLMEYEENKDDLGINIIEIKI